MCSIPNCVNPCRARGWCTTHYKRWKRHGDPNKVLGNLGKTLNERLDFHTLKVDSGCWLWQGGLSVSGYGRTSSLGKIIPAHVASYRRHVGQIPSGMVIDHLATCPKNCINPDHLRLATPKQNNENFSGLGKPNTSGYRGVTWVKSAGRWRAGVSHHNKNHFLGYFPYYELHVAGYKAMMKRMELHTHNDLDRIHFP